MSWALQRYQLCQQCRERFVVMTSLWLNTKYTWPKQAMFKSRTFIFLFCILHWFCLSPIIGQNGNQYKIQNLRWFLMFRFRYIFVWCCSKWTGIFPGSEHHHLPIQNRTQDVIIEYYSWASWNILVYLAELQAPSTPRLHQSTCKWNKLLSCHLWKP